jgi:MFS family permease
MSTKLDEQPGQQQPNKIWNITFASIFLTNMAINLAQYMSNSLLSIYADSLGASASAIGILMSTFAVSALLFKVVAAPAMDTYNRKYLVIGSMAFYATAFFGFSISKSVSLLMFFRVLQGCGMAFGTVCCLVMVSEALPKDRYGTGIGYYSIGQVVSQAIGPTVGLWIARFVGYNVTFTVSACIMVLAALLALNIKIKFKRTKKFKISLNNIIAKEALLPAVVYLFLSMSFCIVNSFLVVFASNQGVTTNIGLYFAVSAATMVFSRPVVGKLTDRYGLVKVCVPAIFCDVIAFFIISCSYTLPIFLFAALISGFGFGACQPAIQTLCMKCVTNERRGAGSSTTYVGADIGNLAGPTIAGFIAQSFGYVTMWRTMVIPLLTAIALLIVFKGKVAKIEKNFIDNAQVG